MSGICAAIALLEAALCIKARAADANEFAGLAGPLGAPPDATRVQLRIITEPGVFENLIIDGERADEDLVRIRTDDVVLRNGTIRNGRGDAPEIYRVRIENWKIHHVLAGTFSEQKVKIFHLALSDGSGELFDRAPGPGEGFEFHGKRSAPTLHAWPFTRLPVDRIIPPGTPPSSADAALPTAVATGWEGMP